ncbi:TetR/AcrR family transcriptional regulator [Dietzia sp. SYD-A1]|uniref:TetR/AcrR family transcriptional regulator n=1 Tax=Dietzia sp. SYD-A1 TaxID=2780141 RepID=UPI001890E8AF|nr:TetR/AcrR family transcriptional regulator [Dietzia sp. SYD-A1]
MSSRKYEMSRRAQTAALTRGRILDAAESLFVRHGYSRTTLREVARRAGVSVQSVYQAGSKASLMMAILERGFSGEERAVSILARPEFQAIMADPDTERALGRYVDFIVAANGRIIDLWHAAILASDSDPEIAEAVRRSETRRIEDLHLGSGWFVGRGLLPQDRVSEFADVLGHLTGPDTHRYFVRERGWTDERFAQWLRATIAGQLGQYQTGRRMPEGE